MSGITILTSIDMAQFPTVAQFMDRQIESVRPDTAIMEAIDSLVEKRVTGTLVADSEGRLVGILTEFDCLRVFTEVDWRDKSPGAQVKDYMTVDVKTIPPTMDIYQAARLFMGVSFHRFPVVEEGRILGTISRFDTLRAVQRTLASLSPDDTIPVISIPPKAPGSNRP